MVGRVLFLIFGSLILIASWVFSTGHSPVGSPTEHFLFSMIGIGFMLGAVACGAAEGGRRSAPPPPPPGWGAPPQYGPPQQTWPQPGNYPPAT
jgi:hypothetical protein